MLSDPITAVAQMRLLGGPVVNWIFICCMLMWFIVIERSWYFTRVLPGQPRGDGAGVAVRDRSARAGVRTRSAGADLAASMWA